MHKYQIADAVINGNDVRIRKHFASRNKAIAYMMNYYENHYFYGFQLQEENVLGKHRIEYYSTDYNRFTVSRI